MKTAQEYIDSIRVMHHEVYLFGEKIENSVDHPIIRPSINSVAATYELAEDPNWEDLMTTTSHLTGKKVNRFTHIHQSTADLVAKSNMNRMLGAYTGSCFQRCVGMDALNALSIVTHKLASKDRFLDYLQYVQDNDLVCCGAMTDAKGNRSLRPSEQFDPDQYLNVIGRGKDGIVVSGAKLHQTGAINSHEIIVMPTRAMSEKDKDYAISFAIPSDTKGIMYIYGRQSCDTRKMEGNTFDVGNIRYGGQECMVIFNNVFVPWDRVFMCGEYEFTGQLVEQFAAYHRHSYACKAGIGDVLIGAAQLLAQYQGIDKASHIKDKIVEMTHLNETLYCGSVACAYKGYKEASGTYAVDPLLANVAKLNVTRFPYEIARLAQEIAGGILVTMPSEKDFWNPVIGKTIGKYLKTTHNITDRMRILRLIENLTMGTGAVCYLTESMHGAGSPQAQRIMIQRLANMQHNVDSAKRLCGVKE